MIPLEVQKRFWEKVDCSGGIDACWEWTATKHGFGYGHFKVGTQNMKAHRVSYILRYGEIPDGLFVLHHCDNPPCVNPSHLFVGTHLDNGRDKAKKGRSAYVPGSMNGNSKLSSVQVLEIRKLRKNGFLLREIGSQFDITETQVSNIVRKKQWSNI